MSCPTFQELTDYWLGDAAELERIEDHQFGCDRCTRRLAWLAGLAVAIPDAMRRRGGMRLTLTAELVAHLERDGVVLRQYRPERNADIACTVAMDDDLSVTWVIVDPAPGERIDLELRGPDGAVRLRAEDVPVDPAIGQVITAVASETLRPLPAVELHLRVLAVGPAGERTLGEYTYRHTPMTR
jgi:hypothetical protein